MAFVLNPQSSRNEVADYLELRALLDPDGVSSALQLVTDLCLGGNDSAYEDLSDAERSTWQTEREALAQEALEETARRSKTCGATNYPFDLQATSLKATSEAPRAVYTFLLVLSFLKGNAPHHATGAKLFEELSAAAGAGYLGCDSSKEAYVFGFPRRRGPKNFLAAVTELCGKQLLNEGSANSTEPKLPQQKDARLDVVVWKNFPDRRRGRLILFGQCATGSDWEDKAYALDPQKWREKWLIEPFLPHPQGGFFVPFAVEDRDWKHHLLDGGILFDRFRIAGLAPSHLTAVTLEQIASWNRDALSDARMELEAGV
jgi:hypothetical protein